MILKDLKNGYILNLMIGYDAENEMYIMTSNQKGLHTQAKSLNELFLNIHELTQLLGAENDQD